MKRLINKIKRRYFPHKVKLIAAEESDYITELDKAFIYACIKLKLKTNRKGWFNADKIYFNSNEYITNKYDFFKFNFKIQTKCLETGHLKELVYQMTMKLTDSNYWTPYFKFMGLFDDKEDKIGFVIYNWAYMFALNIYIKGKCLGNILPDLIWYSSLHTHVSWGFIQTYYDIFFKEDDKKLKSFSILNIPSNSSLKEIKAAYRKLVLIYHPDKPNGNTEMFRKINTAYNYLIDNFND